MKEIIVHFNNRHHYKANNMNHAKNIVNKYFDMVYTVSVEDKNGIRYAKVSGYDRDMVFKAIERLY